MLHIYQMYNNFVNLIIVLKQQVASNLKCMNVFGEKVLQK